MERASSFALQLQLFKHFLLIPVDPQGYLLHCLSARQPDSCKASSDEWLQVFYPSRFTSHFVLGTRDCGLLVRILQYYERSKSSLTDLWLVQNVCLQLVFMGE